MGIPQPIQNQFNINFICMYVCKTNCWSLNETHERWPQFCTTHTLVVGLRLFSFRFLAFDTQEFVNNFQLLCKCKTLRTQTKRGKSVVRKNIWESESHSSREKKSRKRIPGRFSYAFHCSHKNTFIKFIHLHMLSPKITKRNKLHFISKKIQVDFTYQHFVLLVWSVQCRWIVQWN